MLSDPTQKYRLSAKFVLNDHGEPSYLETNGTRHYKIIVTLESEGQPPSVVTYYLHPSYYDPIREVFTPQNNFELPITAFGDFVLEAKLRTENGVIKVQESLARLLRQTYRATASAPIQSAISMITTR